MNLKLHTFSLAVHFPPVRNYGHMTKSHIKIIENFWLRIMKP